MKKISLTILLLLTILSVSAQSKPVTVVVSLSPPYSPFLNEYASTTGSRLQVTLIVNDSRMINYPVKLQMFVERPDVGIVMRTSEYASIPPILLNGGATEVLSGASLSLYFQAINNVFSGFDQSQYLQTGRIPDGQYRIGFMVVDAQRSDVRLSNLVYSQPGWFLLNDPPQLNLPVNLSEEKVQDIQDVKLEWYPRHVGSMNSSFPVSYQVELFALRVPGMNPQQVALSLQPDYTDVTNQNYFRLSQDKFLLEPGIEYAWRVKAISPDGLTLFQNNGYSEVFSFVYGSLCPTPKNTDADVKGTDAAEISWDYDPMPSSWEVRFRLKDDDNAIWHTRQMSNNSALLSEILTPATGYEYQVKAVCSNTESEYSPIKSFNTDAFVPPANFDCGKSNDTTKVTNYTPKLNLNPGDIIFNGKFPVKITEVEGSAGTFKGKGRMRIPMLANIQINMQFTGLKVNEENQVYGGEMVSVYNENSPFFIEDLSDYFGEGDQIGNIITGQDSAAIILTYEVSDPGDLNIVVNGDNVTITGGGSTTSADVDDAGNGFTVQDADGTLFSVEVNSDGTTTVTEIGTSGGAVSGSDYNEVAGGYNQLDNDLVVTFSNNGKWAFDERKAEYENSLFDSEYEKIGEYYVPWKFVPLGKSDKIKARVTSGTIQDSEKLKFLTPTGTEFNATYENGEYLLEVIGGKERDGIEVYAIYMPDDTTKISAGKLKIASYPRIDRDVKLIPMADFRIDGIISEDILNEIYNPYYIHWHITIEPRFTNTSWDEGNDGLQATGSEFYSMFTPEMRALNAAYTEERGVDEKSLYLFVFPKGNSEGGLMGDMPLKSRFGYIFNADGADARKITQTVAHELGHGAFQLKHTFSDKYNIDKYKTKNLMDYPESSEVLGGTELVKYQWDVVHDPQNKLFNWMQGEEEGQQGEELKPRDPENKSIEGQTAFTQAMGKNLPPNKWYWHTGSEETVIYGETAAKRGYKAGWYKWEQYFEIVKDIVRGGAHLKINTGFVPGYEEIALSAYIDNYKGSEYWTDPETGKWVSNPHVNPGLVEENLVFDFISLGGPGIFYKGGKAFIKGIFSIINTKSIIMSLKGMTIGTLLFIQVDGTVLNVAETSVDDIIKATIQEGKNITISQGSREIGTITDGVLNPANFAGEEGTVVSRIVTTSVNDAGKVTEEIAEAVMTPKGLVFRKTITNIATIETKLITEAELANLTKVKPTGANSSYIGATEIATKAKRITPAANSNVAGKVDDYIATTSTSTRGSIGEEIAETLVKDMDGFTHYPCKLNASDNGFDVVAVKGSLENPIEIRLLESKPMNNGSVSLSTTATKGTQMSDRWIDATIDQMRNSQDLNLQKIGNMLFKNKNNIQKYITTIDKGSKQIVVIKLDKF